MGYQSASDGFNPKLTGQHRDTENFLDYFHARYYSPEQGRFVSADPGNAGADPASPQTWNGYAYVGNNPLNVTDPSGLEFFDFLGGLIHNILNAASFGTWGVITSAVNGTPPGFGSGFVGVPGFGDFFGCGGPLGTCGTLGAGPWSERTGLDSVQDPGRFIFDATPVGHHPVERQFLKEYIGSTFTDYFMKFTTGPLAPGGPHRGYSREAKAASEASRKLVLNYWRETGFNA